MGPAFQGIRVLEICSMVPGPFCSRILADLGAEVVKIEPPQVGDESRYAGPFPGDQEDASSSFLFHYLNVNKFGITLEVAQPEGRAVLGELLQKADVLVIDFPPRDLKKANLDLQQIARDHASLIIASITPFGLTGPHADYNAYYLNTYHSGPDGYLNPSGRLANKLYPDREPLRAGGYYGEYQAGAVAAVSVVAAIYSRNFSGKGALLDISKQEALMSLDPGDIVQYANGSGMRTRFGRIALYLGGLTECRDGFWVLQLHFDRQWEALKKCMENPQWAQDPRFDTVEGRHQHRGDLERLIEEWARSHTKQDIYHRLQQAEVSAVPVLTPTEVLADEQLKSREFFMDGAMPSVGRVPVASLPFRPPFSHSPAARQAPSLGQHNGRIYQAWLGYPESKIKSLEASGVI